MTEVLPLHASIVQAICKIQMSMEADKKSQRNAHGGYNFSSTDDFYAALSRKMGEAGLVIIPLEVEHDIVRVEKEGKTVQWLKVTYAFILATADATWRDPHARRSLYLQVTGPQTHQSAQSYAEKSFLRSIFKMPSGDMDLDSLPQAETEDAQEALNGNGKKRKSSYAAKKDGTSEKFDEIKKAFETCQSIDMLEKMASDLYAEDISQLPMHWATIISNTYEDRMDALRSNGHG